MARSKKKTGDATAEAAPAATAPQEAVVEETPVVAAEAKAKAKAKTKAKAKAEPKAEAAPKAAAEPKAKVKGEAKAKADAKAQAEPTKPKADAKAKAKASASAATPQAVMKSSPKTKPAPPVVVEEVAADDGMETVAKKKGRRRKKAQEMTEEEEAEILQIPQGPSEEEMKRKMGHTTATAGLSGKLWQVYKSLPGIKSSEPEKIMTDATAQKKSLDSILKEIDETLKGVKISRPKNQNPGKIMEQMRELRMCKDDGTFTEETKKQMLEDLETALAKAWAFEAFKDFQADMGQLREVVEKKIKETEEALKHARAGNVQRRNLQRVAQAKGMKVEELEESMIKNTEVDLVPEVAALSFLYLKKLEKQHGVVLDRPDNGGKGSGKDGGKGSGKGNSDRDGRPPKGFVVRGLEAEVAACVVALRALDLSEKKVISVDGRQASLIIGQQQANARKIEAEFPGVYVHSEKDQVTLYGPKKKVAECQAHVQGIIDGSIAVAPSSDSRPAGGGEKGDRPARNVFPLMNIDKDCARALIGVDGKVVKRIQTSTNTSIKVRGISSKDKDEEKETLATVQINGDRENQEKAKKEIEEFMKALAVVLVEAESDAVSRLYDGAIGRKGRGKGKSKTDDNGGNTTKFGELRDTSGLTVVRKPKGIQLVGPKADVEKWKAVLLECIEDAGFVPMVIKLVPEQTKIWDAEHLESVKEKSGAKSVQLTRRGRDAALEITGTEQQQEKAKEAIEEVNSQLGHMETIENVPAVGTRSLMAKGAGRLKDIEQKHEVSITVDRQTQAVKILGTKEAVEEAKKALDALIETAKNSTSKEIEIEWDEGRIVIGKGGATVRKIRSDLHSCGLDDLQVEDHEEKKKVIFRGTEEGIEAAMKMVQEALEEAKKNPPHASPTTGENNDAEPRKKEGKGGGRGGKGKGGREGSEETGGGHSKGAEAHKGGGKGDQPAGKKQASTAAKKSRVKEPNIESQELFPTLGSTDGGKKKSPGGAKKSTAWGKVDDGAVGEDAEKKEEAAQQEEEDPAEEEEDAEDAAEESKPEKSEE